MCKKIYVVENNEKIQKRLQNVFKNKQKYLIIKVTAKEILSEIDNIPDLIIINDDDISADTVRLCKKIRKQYANIFSPIMVVTSKKDEEYKLNIYKNKVEYIIDSKHSDEYIYYAIKNLMHVITNNRKLSPLTGLAGNLQIQLEIKNRLNKKENFDVLYIDLDNFKAYNDKYGFLQGDEIIKFTAVTILNAIQECQLSNAFVGHIGGDDFVAIINNEDDSEKLAQTIIRFFNSEILNYFDKEDIKRGYIEAENRQGKTEKFAFTAISIGIVKVSEDVYDNVLEIAEAGAQMKHIAKLQEGSSYSIKRTKRKGRILWKKK